MSGPRGRKAEPETRERSLDKDEAWEAEEDWDEDGWEEDESDEEDEI